MAKSYKTHPPIIDYTLRPTYMFCGTNTRTQNFIGDVAMEKRIFGWLALGGASAILAGCAAPLLMAAPTLFAGAQVAHMTALVTKERGVTVTFDEKSVETVTAQKGNTPVRTLGVVSTSPHVIGGGGGVAVAVAVAEELSTQKSFAVVTPAQVTRYLSEAGRGANMSGKTKADVSDDLLALCGSKRADAFVIPNYQPSMGPGSIDGMQAMLSFGMNTKRKDKMTLGIFTCDGKALREMTGTVEVDIGAKTPDPSEIDKVVGLAMSKQVTSLFGGAQ